MASPLPTSTESRAATIPYAFSRTHGVLAWREEGDRVVVLLRPDASVDALTEVRRVLGRAIVTRAVDAETFAAELAKAYNQAGAAVALSESLANEADLARLLQEMPASEDLLDAGAQAPVIRMINALLLEALRERASDLHFEPYDARAVVRFRIDGMLRDAIEPPRALHGALVSRLKIMAGLDIAEKRLPQDGRIKIRFSDDGATKEIDFRVSCLPTLFGEKIVMRLLDKDKLMLDMTKLGFETESLTRFEAAIGRPWGMVLVTGPTGSGKTNTLYSSIAKLNTPETNIMTAEDPVEFNLAGINQVQVKDNIGLNFAAALRSFLRQDPN
ncbi:MAG TPA: GspE/PulE family protein, partial [Casimicrobiaceae bacterium]|nr:GspE/PulE family protein [Casimicrobiaceae bacterium]